MKHIYLDHAASTPADPRVIRVVSEISKLAGHPSAFNNAGRQAQTILTTARKQVADFLHARPDEIVFTSSDSESISLALTGFLKGKKGRVLTTPIEHSAVLKTLASLPGIKVDFVDLDECGRVDLIDLKKKIKKDTLLVSVMYANNEIGTIQPVAKIGRILRGLKDKPVFHVDACQATAYLDMNVQNLGADLLTFNSIKIYGPKGIAVIYQKRGVVPQALTRAGTENVPAIAGLAKALELIKPGESKKIAALRDYVINKIQKEIPEVLLSGPTGDERLPNNIHISLPNMSNEVLLLELDKYGISAGSGSACTSHSVEPSHVLKAIGVPTSHINGALRFSLGRNTTKADLDYLVATLKKIIPNIRKRYSRAR